MLTIGLTWWLGTQQREFVMPPDENALAQIREQTKEELKAADFITPEQPIRVKPKKLPLPDAEKEAQALATLKPEEFGDPTVAPGLDCYRVHAGRGATLLADLATQLETRGDMQRALLAWERVVDSAEADSSQLDTASDAIQRLRGRVPLWNVDPTTTTTILLNARCHPEHKQALEPIFLEIISVLNKSNCGLIDFQVKLQSGPKPVKGLPPQPVALWFSGAAGDSAISKTISIPLASSSTEQQKNQLLLALYKLLRDSFRDHATLRPLRDPMGHDPAILLETAITRRTWEVWAQTFTSKKS